jgi:ABC-2 type transport system ATP-binding protein
MVTVMANARPSLLSTAASAQAISTADTAMLSCRNLHKAYGSLVAVRDLSLETADGETYGLLGPNGAGKTTAISMLAGVLEPDAGEIVVAGDPLTVRAARTRRHIGYVPQEVAVYPDLTARENLRFFARLYGMSRSDGRARTEEVLRTIGLRERAGELVGKYSGGMRRRLNIGIGLLHRPRLLILDEPTVGVDPQSRNAILESVEALSGAGMAVHRRRHRAGVDRTGRRVRSGASDRDG